MNNNNTNNSSAGGDDSSQPSPIRSLGVTVKLEKGVSIPNVTSIVHESSVEGSDSIAGTASSSNENPLVIPSSLSPTTPPLSPPRLSNQSIILTGPHGDKRTRLFVQSDEGWENVST